MRALVTGAAGFIGSHLVERLLDAFTDFYPRARKESNIAGARARPGFRFVEADLVRTDLPPLLEGIDVVFHLAAQPGVRPSWGKEFDVYIRHNIAVTQRLLEASIGARLHKFVYASSSSIYGNAEALPTREDARPEPVSPYGVTKLAAEHLCDLYRAAHSTPAASLRLFTVYGPRQRPDMAFSRLVRTALEGGTFELYGDGAQTRDFTYVGDVTAAMQACAASDWTGTANVGGGDRVPLNDAIRILTDHAGPVRVERRPVQRGDVRDTAADTSLARSAFGYEPHFRLEEGLARMVAWVRSERQAG
jgi:nucleoside-diphosphate-sugar epimerase